MDRFIEEFANYINEICPHLKSSMDRFIVEALAPVFDLVAHLKSSMDRFIGLILIIMLLVLVI